MFQFPTAQRRSQINVASRSRPVLSSSNGGGGWRIVLTHGNARHHKPITSMSKESPPALRTPRLRIVLGKPSAHAPAIVIEIAKRGKETVRVDFTRK
jgi:hypothetical protein